MISRNLIPRAGQTAAGGMPATPPDPHNLFLAVLPFVVVIAVAITDVLAGPDVGFLPVLSLGPALGAISRRPLSTALIGMLTLGLGVLLAIYDNLADSRRGVIALITIAGVTAAGVVASAGRQRRERELANFKAIAEAALTGSARHEIGTGPFIPLSGPGRFSECGIWAPGSTRSSKTSWRTWVTRSWMTPRCS